MERGREDTEGLLQRTSGHVHPLAREVATALKGAVWPLRRDELLVVAGENEAAKTVLSLLAGLPDRLFRSEPEVAEWLDDPSVSR